MNCLAGVVFASAIAVPVSFAASPSVPAKKVPAAPMTSDVRLMSEWVLATRDHQGMPFVIIDKKQARVFVFEPGGKLLGGAAALMGAAKGDNSVPGIGEKPIASILPEERTTPAGRFVAEVGHNANGEDIVWVDYDAAVSMHRVRANNPKERRLQRLASATPADNRISYGCINLPKAFYENVVSPAFSAAQGGVVYILPEKSAVAAVFGGLKTAALVSWMK
ncbi:MAG: L,D-transpeptidase [Pseudomonadota bacterium]